MTVIRRGRRQLLISTNKKRAKTEGKEFHAENMEGRKTGLRLLFEQTVVYYVWMNVCLFATALKKPEAEGKKCHPKTMKIQTSW